MSTKPTLIFVHGAWHGPECWQKHVVPGLENKGYKCVAEQMKFAGPEAKPGVGVKPSIEQAATLIESQTSQGRDVVVINHSFGGAIGPSAIKGYTNKDASKLKEKDGRVIGIIHITGFVAPPNTALMDIIQDREAAFHFADDDGFEKIRPDRDPVDIFYGLCNDDEKATLPKQLKPLASASFEGPPGREEIYAGWLDVPMLFLRCTEDHAIPIQVQDLMIGSVKEAGGNITERTLETDHSPFYSRPAETIDIIDEAAKSFMA